MPYLEYDNQSRPLGPGVLTVGSGTEANWRILGRELLPLHGVFTFERDGRALLSKGAPHASVWINGEELEERLAVLSFGDRVRLGNAEFVFRQFLTAEHRDGYFHDTRRGRLYKLDAPTTQIGRETTCVILVQDPEVSRFHAEILRDDAGHYAVRPMGSAYTLLNANRIAETRPLKEGDEVTVGRTVFRFTFEPAAHMLAGMARHSQASKRAAKMQTMFVGPIAAREMLAKRERRRYGLIGAAVFGAIAAHAMIVHVVQALIR